MKQIFWRVGGTLLASALIIAFSLSMGAGEYANEIDGSQTSSVYRYEFLIDMVAYVAIMCGLGYVRLGKRMLALDTAASFVSAPLAVSAILYGIASQQGDLGPWLALFWLIATALMLWHLSVLRSKSERETAAYPER